MHAQYNAYAQLKISFQSKYYLFFLKPLKPYRQCSFSIRHPYAIIIREFRRKCFKKGLPGSRHLGNRLEPTSTEHFNEFTQFFHCFLNLRFRDPFHFFTLTRIIIKLIYLKSHHLQLKSESLRISCNHGRSQDFFGRGEGEHFENFPKDLLRKLRKMHYFSI